MLFTFDFAEGESELVSGFNVEYRRGGFALIKLLQNSYLLDPEAKNLYSAELLTAIMLCRSS